MSRAEAWKTQRTVPAIFSSVQFYVFYLNSVFYNTGCLSAPTAAQQAIFSSCQSKTVIMQPFVDLYDFNLMTYIQSCPRTVFMDVKSMFGAQNCVSNISTLEGSINISHCFWSLRVKEVQVFLLYLIHLASAQRFMTFCKHTWFSKKQQTKEAETNKQISLPTTRLCICSYFGCFTVIIPTVVPLTL